MIQSAENQTISDLRQKLFMARHTIIEIMPEEIQEILRGYYSCESRIEVSRWHHETAKKIVELAEILPKEVVGYHSGPRAYCPLCHSGSTHPYETGFSVPEGLRRHLEGEGNTHRCSVMDAVYGLTRQYCEKFAASEEEERRQKEQRRAERRQTETLFRIAPNEEPILIDDRSFFGKGPRDESELAWAEQRLIDLGFQIVVEGNVKSYLLEYQKWMVFADPRAKGVIGFRPFKKPIPKRISARSSRVSHYPMIELKDAWKHDLLGKYEKRLAQSLKVDVEAIQKERS